MNKLNVMMDIETLSTKQNACIIQAAAVLFNEDGTIKDFLKCCISIDSNIGRHVSESTLLFWMDMVELFKKITENTTSLYQFIVTLQDRFKTWEDNFKGEIVLWCHENFDSEIIKNAFEQFELNFPVKYNNVRGLRSLYDYITDKEYDAIKANFEESEQHDAYNDCLFQIKLLTFVWEKLKKYKENI